MAITVQAEIEFPSGYGSPRVGCIAIPRCKYSSNVFKAVAVH